MHKLKGRDGTNNWWMTRIPRSRRFVVFRCSMLW
ncbi:hypothetical protein CEXT_185711, partial [Caerostris extrusa]